MEFLNVSYTDSGVTVHPGQHWNLLAQDVRRSNGGDKARHLGRIQELGTFIGSASVRVVHGGMLEFTANHFVRATEPPFSHEEEDAFRKGVQSLYDVALAIDRVAMQAEQAATPQGGVES